jgi:hypothetical protein
MTINHRLAFVFFAFTSLGLSSCGGGSSNANPGPTPPPVSQGALAAACAASADGLAVIADSSVAVGKPAGAMVLGCVNSPRELKWTQTAGPNVAVYADRMQAMSFQPTSQGTYTFSVAVTDAQGVLRNRSVSINADAALTGSGVGARLDQSVFGGSDVSLRAWPANFTGAVKFA